MRFYELTAGEIMLGGILDTCFSLESLRRQIVLMPQSPAFFHDTIRENLLVAQPTAADSEIQELCERTGIWPILVEAYGGGPPNPQILSPEFLSGGEKKKFSFLRFLPPSPSIFFFFLQTP